MDYVEEVTLEVAEFTSLEEQAAAADGDKKPAATDGDESCVVCLVERKTHIFTPCGHNGICAHARAVPQRSKTRRTLRAQCAARRSHRSSRCSREGPVTPVGPS